MHTPAYDTEHRKYLIQCCATRTILLSSPLSTDTSSYPKRFQHEACLHHYLCICKLREHLVLRAPLPNCSPSLILGPGPPFFSHLNFLILVTRALAHLKFLVIKLHVNTFLVLLPLLILMHFMRMIKKWISEIYVFMIKNRNISINRPWKNLIQIRPTSVEVFFSHP